MFKLRTWLSSLLVVAVTAVPVVAGSNEAKTGNENSANSTSAEAGPAAANASAEPSPNPSPSPSVSVGTTAGEANLATLLNVLVKKGVLAPTEANSIRNAAPGTEFQLLVQALSRKGILNAADLSAAASPAAAQPAVVVAADPAEASETESSSESTSIASADPEPAPQAGHPTPAIQGTQPPPPPGVIPAIAPLRVIAADPPVKDGLVPAFKLGAVKMTPYGFIKATAVHDSSSPNGDDFPFVGLFLNNGTDIFSTGPTKDPEFHIKARSTRVGSNFEWPDPSPKLTFTGRIEGDYEGNFSEVDNRDVSSIRSNAFQLRLAYVRMDYAATDKSDIFFEGGQDWTLFGSTALPNILETTFLGAYYGDIYERSPQMMVGLIQKVGNSSRWNFKIDPTFAIMMPSTGQIEKLGSLGLAAQLAQAEREGADSDRPEYEGRLAFQFQLDKAPAVAPAQIFWSGFKARRTSITTTADYGNQQPSCLANLALCEQYEAAYPNGFQVWSNMWGNQLGIQLPTRWATLTFSAYKGGDLRFFFGGQVNSFFTDVGNIGPGSAITFATIDGGPLAAAGPSQLGCSTALVAGEGGAPLTCPGSVVIVPQRPIRGFGGFLNLGLPISRWFNANPKGHNAGWQLYLDIGKDQVVHKDLVNPNAEGTLPLLMGKMFAATLYYKVNPWCTFGLEQSVYATRLAPGLNLYDIAGVFGNEWQDHRTEFGPVFTF
jgi:hypothetical protein